MELIDILGFVIAGFLGGFLSGMLGVGGGIVFVPVIQQVLINNNIKEDFVAYTLANSLALVFVIGITGTIKQLHLKNTHLRSAAVTGISAIITSLSITFLIDINNWNNPKIFNIIFGMILIFAAVRMLFSRNDDLMEIKKPEIPSAVSFVPAGLFAGFVTALSGLGGGIIMVPYFNKILKLPIKFSTGLSLSVIPIIAFPILIFYAIKQPHEPVYLNFQTGYLIWPVIIPVVAAAIVASQLGIRFAQKLKPQIIKLIFVVFVLLTLGKILIFQ